MKTFIEKYKKLLKFYHIALRLSGWLLLILGICSYGIKLILVKNLGASTMGIMALNMPLGSFDFILFGLLGLGIAQLIRYLFDSECSPGCILRHGGTFLYAYVVLILIVMAIRFVFTMDYLRDSDIQNAQSLFFVTSVTSVVLFAAKALILIGVAQFLKRIMPIIEEYKSLV